MFHQLPPELWSIILKMKTEQYKRDNKRRRIINTCITRKSLLGPWNVLQGRHCTHCRMCNIKRFMDCRLYHPHN